MVYFGLAVLEENPSIITASIALNPHPLMERHMFAEYIAAALGRAEYEIMDEEEPQPYYAHIPDLPGVWATGKTLEDCRTELISVIEGWIALRLRLGDPIPAIGGQMIIASSEPVSVV